MITTSTRTRAILRTFAAATLVAAALPALLAGHAAAQAGPSPSPAVGAVPATPSLEEQLAAAQAQVAALEAENERLASLIDTWADLYDPMEADRQLLLELRKELPDERDAVEAYVDRIQRLGMAADPSRLGQAADRLTETLPTWLDWRFADYTSTGERAAAYMESGASGFDTDLGEFRDMALLVAATHIDAILTIADRIR